MQIIKNITSIFILSVIFLSSFAQSSSKPANATKRERLSLDKGWQFFQGDIPFPVIKGHGESYGNAKAGKAWGAAAQEYDDRQWRTLTLPHDWAVEGGFDSTENLSQGYRKRGIGWYRRNFKISPADKGKHLELQFDGIATYCTVWVNGTVLHRNWCGYTSFYIDITPLAKYGDEINTVAIRVDAVAQEGWWYEGAGIYRHTWLVKRSPLHVITDGVYANPIKKQDGSWEIPAEVTLENTAVKAADAEVEITVTDKAGNKVAGGKKQTIVSSLGQAVAPIPVRVMNPVLWSIEKPVLYTVKTTVRQNGVVVDEVNTRCGFRTFRFTADSGFYLNDKHVKIKGVCNHQDHAGVGVAVPDALWEFRLRKLKEMGVNGYRCAHNPPSAEFLEACDSLGILVMDENRNFNTSDEYVRQLQWLIRRDRNHPSIILWSVFNEEPMQGTENGYEMVRRMSATVKELDTTRPVTAAQSGGQFATINVSQAVDVVGFNYQYESYDRFHKENPAMKLTSSEDVSGLMVRGEYITDRKKNLLDSYDTQKPSWGTTHRVGWKAVAERPFVAGCFVWTGFDYRGEPTPYTWPTAGSNFGIMDVCGFPKAAFYLHQAQWVEDRPVLHLVPHWNWPQDSLGKNIRVMAFSNAETVRLLLNGKSAGEQKVDKYEMNTWYVPYKPGKLEAIGYKNGKEVSHVYVETTGEPVSLQLLADRKTLDGDGRDAMPITVQALDAKGRPVATANLPVEFQIAGNASIIGLGNGNPNSHEAEKGNKRSLFNGLAQVIIQSRDSASGNVELIATSPGLKPARVIISINKKEQEPFVPVGYPALVLDKWNVSPVFTSKPDPGQEVSGNDMNSWAPVKPGQLQEMREGNFIVYRTVFTPYATQQAEGGKLTLRRVTGKAEVWMDNQLIGTKSNPEASDLTVNFPPSKNERKLNVLIESRPGTKAGLGGVVIVK